MGSTWLASGPLLFVTKGQRTPYCLLAHMHVLWLSASSGVPLHVVMVHSVFGVFDEHTSVTFHVCPGLRPEFLRASFIAAMMEGNV